MSYNNQVFNKSEEMQLISNQILIFPCNGHGTPAVTQTITCLGIAHPEIKITSISTNCDSGGATGNHILIMKQLVSKYPGFLCNAVGDYMKLTISLLKHNITKHSSTDDIRVARWEDIIEPKLFGCNSRSSDSQVIFGQIRFFVDSFDFRSNIETYLHTIGGMSGLVVFVNDYCQAYWELRQSNSLVDSSTRGEPVWFYILYDYLYNQSGRSSDLINKLWLDCEFFYPNYTNKPYGNQAHTIQYNTLTGRTLIDENQIDNRERHLELDMSSGVILDSKNHARIQPDTQIGKLVRDCDTLIIPLGSYETTYLYLKLHLKDIIGKQTVILLVNSNIPDNHRGEYQFLLNLLDSCNLSELILMGAKQSFLGLDLPANSQVEFIHQLEDNKLDTAQLNTAILEHLKERSVITPTELTRSIETKLIQARLTHLVPVIVGQVKVKETQF